MSRNSYSDKFVSDIFEVVTRTEAATLWGVALTTIDIAINKGQLVARRSIGGGAVLISIGSMAARYGTPVKNKTTKEFKQSKDDMLNLPDYQRDGGK